MKEKFRNINWDLPITLLLISFGYLLIHSLAGGTLFNHEMHDSYTLQALAWLKGDIILANGKDLKWLELAIYQGNYYVSSPPLPAVVMLPMVLLFGDRTPNNLMVAIYAMVAVTGVYFCFRTKGTSSKFSCFWAVFIVLASNMAEISTNGGVWLQAQTLNMALLVWGVYFALRNKRMASLLLFALAVGCRPFSAIYVPVALFYFYYQDYKAQPQAPPLSLILKLWKPIVVAGLVGLCYMWYNYIRFKDVFEFGHNYLPEFTQAKDGQFSLNYVANNLKNIFFKGMTLSSSGKLEFDYFGGFMFYVVNPIFIVWFFNVIKSILNKQMDWAKIAICAGLLLNLFILTMHKSFGGYQFGARYTLDLIPFALFFLVLSNKQVPRRWEVFLCVFGLMLNTFGAIIMRLAQLGIKL